MKPSEQLSTFFIKGKKYEPHMSRGGADPIKLNLKKYFFLYVFPKMSVNLHSLHFKTFQAFCFFIKSLTFLIGHGLSLDSMYKNVFAYSLIS